MSFSYQFSIVDDVLRVTCDGLPDSLTSMMEYVEATYAEARRCGVSKMLVDESNLLAQYDYHRTLTAMTLDPEVRQARMKQPLAVICAPHSLDMYALFNDCENEQQSFNAQVFAETEAGMHWLQQQPLVA